MNQADSCLPCILQQSYTISCISQEKLKKIMAYFLFTDKIINKLIFRIKVGRKKRYQ